MKVGLPITSGQFVNGIVSDVDKVKLICGDLGNTSRYQNISSLTNRYFLTWFDILETFHFGEPLGSIEFFESRREHPDYVCNMEVAEREAKNADDTIKNLWYSYEQEKLYVRIRRSSIKPEMAVKLKYLQLTMHKEKNKSIEQYIDFTNALLHADQSKVDKFYEAINSKYKELTIDKLDDVFQINKPAEVKQLNDRIHDLTKRISDMQNRIARHASEIRESKEKLKFLKNKSKTDNTLFFKYLKKHPYISEITPTLGSRVILKYEAPLLYYDEDEIKEQLTEENYPTYFLKALLDKKFELWTCSEIIFDTQNFTVESNGAALSNYIGHPHITRFSCFGDHREAISDSALSGDYFGAIEQITQAVLNFNIVDSIVTSELCDMLEATALKTWKNKETGEFVNTKTVMNYY